MRCTALIAGLAALAVANPTPQVFDASELSDIEPAAAVDVPIGTGSQILPLDVDAIVDSAYAEVLADPSPDVDASIPAAISRRSLKRGLEARSDPCAGQAYQPKGYGPPVSPDTPGAFVGSTALSNAAQSAQAPYGFKSVFQDYKASVSTSGYRGYKTYTSYDATKAASDCRAIKGCISFNIFFERDPLQDPSATCNPGSTNVIKASFWSAPLTKAVATNSGQYRNQFQVVIAGSNAYNLVDCAGELPGWTKEVYNGCTINAPATSCHKDKDAVPNDAYLTMSTIADGEFYPERCQSGCDAVTASNPLKPCNFVTSWAYILDDKYQYQVCAFYERYFDNSYCTNKGGQTDKYGRKTSIGYSYSYTNNKDNGVSYCPLTS